MMQLLPSTCNNSNLQHQYRNFSFYQNNNNNSYNTFHPNQLMGPSYQIYGEDSALTVRAIPPEFRQLPSGKIVLNTANSRGRLLLQFNPRSQDGRYQWDQSIRFALSAEEAASVFLARLDPQRLYMSQHSHNNNNNNDDDTVTIAQPPNTVAVAEIVRRANANNFPDPTTPPPRFDEINSNDSIPEKIFRARLQDDGSVHLVVDFERDGIGGQEPPSNNETRGPIAIDLMVGEYHVLRSIVQYSLPRLIGWSAMLDASLEQSIEKSAADVPSPHNYQGRNGGEVPF
ncbi:Whirly transcription factor domain containing protein [Nitzschia inconspicua]|uniref:Whirly transcription factor domain containing protein n=1 Tax=Nitzschia inconspicua TaxID=303405 RepID=A0A9K3LI06_9STRA|nr:Whirly transcription factor domain containing protein [Nitzschia inconspicua]KAG7362477.1 Whirly transcription factor domain containing protein [Nitzschia inconspicua]